MTDPRTLAAFDLPPDATGPEIAVRMRELAGLPARPDTNIELWTHLLDAVEWACKATSDPRCDRAEFADGVVSSTIAPPGRPDAERFGTIPWDQELGVTFPHADDVLRPFAYGEIATRVDAVGLIRLV